MFEYLVPPRLVEIESFGFNEVWDIRKELDISLFIGKRIVGKEHHIFIPCTVQPVKPLIRRRFVAGG